MKKYFFLFVFLLPFCFCFAQENAQDKKWNISLQINTPERKSPLEELTETPNSSAWNDEANLYLGVSGKAKTNSRLFAMSLTCNYYSRKDFFYRVKTGINSVNIQLLPDEKMDTNAHYYYNSSRKQLSIISSFGIGKEVNIQKFVLYGGLEMPFTYYGKSTVHSHYSYDYQNIVNWYSVDLDGKIFNSYSIGIGNFLGLGINFGKFHIGSEISIACLYNKRLSATEFHYVEKNSFNIITTNDIIYNPKVSTIEISKIKSAITFSFHF